jgi:uncharacterized protein YecE (DUF72 family)
MRVMPRGTCHVGTSGWSYSHWAGGRFYPRGLKPGEWLAFLAGQFHTVELNASFYRPPRPEAIAKWRQAVPASFRFAVKLWRRITHERRLANCESELRSFLERVGGLGPRRGPLLVQLPPSLRRDVELLAAFLAALRSAAGRRRWRVAVEFRSPDWLSQEVGELLSAHEAALCLSDLPRCPATEPNAAPFVYVRRHGPTGRYRGRYGEEHIRADAERVRGWLAAGRDVYVYYNNDIEGHAVDNARELIEQLGRE